MAHKDPPFRPDVPSMEMKPEYIELMIDCWNDEPEERPHFYRIVERLKKESGRYISVKYINFFYHTYRFKTYVWNNEYARDSSPRQEKGFIVRKKRPEMSAQVIRTLSLDLPPPTTSEILAWVLHRI